MRGAAKACFRSKLSGMEMPFSTDLDSVSCLGLSGKVSFAANSFIILQLRAYEVGLTARG